MDLDRVAEHRVGPLLPYIRREGEEAFRRLEREVLQELLAGPDAVIATGGGTACLGDNMDRMKAAGTVVWLDVPMPELLPRLVRSGGDRPLLFGLRGGELEARASALLAQREPFYAQADIIVQAGEAPEVVAWRIAKVLV